MRSSEAIYVDSSVLLAFLLHERVAVFPSDGQLVTSELSELECRRTLDRIRIQERRSDEEMARSLSELHALFQSLRVIRVDSVVLKRAKAAFPTVVRSLDSIHIATAELSGARRFISRDKQQGNAASALGMQIIAES